MPNNTNQPTGQPNKPHQRPSVRTSSNATQAPHSKQATQPGAPAGAGATSASAKPDASATGAAAAAAKAAPKKRTGLIVGIVVGVIVVIGIIVGVVFALNNNDDFYDSNSIIGQAPYKSAEEIQAELDRIVEEGMLNISIASVIEFEDGTSEGVAYIENVPGNHYVMQVDITLDDTGEKVYESGGLKPDSYIEKIKLSKDLDAGEYPATATFHALDEESLQEVGSAAAKVTLNVLN